MKIHWVFWEEVCKYNDDWGLSLVYFSLRNRAMLNKWLWRFASKKDHVEGLHLYGKVSRSC